MTMNRKNIYIGLAAALMLTACSDDLFDGIGTTSLDDGIAFSITTEEQEDIAVGTRAANNNLETKATPFQGNAAGLYVHTLPYPAVGYHDVTTPADTRAAVADIASTDNFHDSLTIYGYTDKTSTYDNYTYGTTLFGDKGTTLRKANNWRSTVRWPFDATTMKFYAIAPAKAKGLTMGSGTIDYNTAPSFTYTVPDNIKEQPDLLYAASGEIQTNTKSETADKGLDNKVIDLKFQHILTAVRFAQGNIPEGFNITGLTISGIKNTGTFTGNTSSWSAQDGTATYTVIGEDGAKTSHISDGWNKNTYIDGDYALFLMPQELSGATITVKLKAKHSDGTMDNTERTISTTLSGTWQAGFTYTYLITIGTLVDDYVLITSDDQVFDSNTSSSQNGTFTVTSYRNTRKYSGDGATDYTNNATTEDETAATAKPVKWKFGGFYTSTDGKNFTEVTDNTSLSWPYWLTSRNESDAIFSKSTEHAGGYQNSNAFTVAAQEHFDKEATTLSAAKHDASHKAILQGNGTASTVIDLSKARGYQSIDNNRETANSYIINQAGTYIFPLVYGNGIKNGTRTDGSVLEGQKTSYGIVDHNGNAIKRAWIANSLQQYNGKEPTSPTDGDSYITYDIPTGTANIKILWQDQQNLIDDATQTNHPEIVLRSDQETDDTEAQNRLFAKFTIQNSNIKPGNALIGVYANKITHTYSTSTGNWSESTEQQLAWTWHIWVTDEVYPNKDGALDYHLNEKDGAEVATLTNASSATNDIMTVNLGWVPDEDTYDTYGRYVHRDIYVKIQQEDDGLTGFTTTPRSKYIRIQNKAAQDLIRGRYTFYQWGRPTAIPMEQKLTDNMTSYDDKGNLVTGDNQFITLYDNTGSTIATKIVASTNVQDAILLAPDMLRYQGTDDDDWWNTTNLYNFWGGNSESTATTKTLYDPCPPGFKVPNASVFNGFTSDGNDNGESSTNTIYAINGQDRRGAYYYTTHPTGGINYSDPYVYMPATGHWSTNQPVNTLMKYQNEAPGKGYYWLSKYDGSTKKGFYLRIEASSKPENNHVYFNNTEDYHDGLPIRPMVD